MSEALYERYKDALRRGHVAGLRGRLDVALAAYVEAATLAPERSLPHASIGAVYLRLDRPADALVAFDAALTRAPSDEPALRGRADALLALDRPSEAAAVLDSVVVLVERAGRMADALDVACRALDLAESRARRRNVRRLLGLVGSADGPVDPALLDRADRLLETTEAAAPPVPPAGSGPGADLEPPMPPPPPPPDPLELVDSASAALDAGDRDAARAALLAAARRFAETGADDAALDACYQAVALAPADPDSHLALTELYLERGWTGAAADKLVLLERLGRLGDDADTVARVRALARERLPGEPKVHDLVG